MNTPRVIPSVSLFITCLVVFVVLPAPPASAALSDCPSGSICLWSRPNYSGTMLKISATSSYRPVTLTSVESYYNHRSKRTWLHEKANGSGAYVCISPGAKKASGLSGWMDSPKAVWLATVTNC